jgi:hypothetical protein
MYGRDEVHVHEGNPKIMLLLGRYKYEPGQMGSGTNPQTTQSNTWSVDLQEYSDA